MHSADVIHSETQNARGYVTGAVMPIFILPGEQPNSVVEIGPTRDGRHTFLAVPGAWILVSPEWAREIANALLEYANREERGLLHPAE